MVGKKIHISEPSEEIQWTENKSTTEKDNLRVLPIRNRERTPWQMQKLRRAIPHATQSILSRGQSLNKGVTAFLSTVNPTVGTLIEHVQKEHYQAVRDNPGMGVIANTVEIARADQDTRESVRREYAAMEANGLYGKIFCEKPDATICIMFENFSSQSLFITGHLQHKKIRQLNKLIGEYRVMDLLAGCKTRTDWRFLMDEENKFMNLFWKWQPYQGHACFECQ